MRRDAILAFEFCQSGRSGLPASMSMARPTSCLFGPMCKAANMAAQATRRPGIVFPVEAASIDAALAISLFSHLLPEDAAAYLKERGGS